MSTILKGFCANSGSEAGRKDWAFASKKTALKKPPVRASIFYLISISCLNVLKSKSILKSRLYGKNISPLNVQSTPNIKTSLVSKDISVIKRL